MRLVALLKSLKLTKRPSEARPVCPHNEMELLSSEAVGNNSSTVVRAIASMSHVLLDCIWLVTVNHRFRTIIT